MDHLFDRLVDFENLHQAYRDARACKRYRSSILKFGYELEENLLALRRELTHTTYRHGGYREFVVTDSKKRVIRAAPFRDRVVHHAVCNVIEPIFERGFIYDSYACRKGKGTHAAILRLEYFIKSLESASRVRERETAAPRG
jgi:RNA-directed DNA polymerase